MRFDHASGDLQLIWNTFLDFEAFTREADGDLNFFIEEWKEKMVRVQSTGCHYSELLLGLKLLEKVNLSSDSIMSIISKLGSSNSNSDNFLVQVVTYLKSESGINGCSVENTKEKSNQSGTHEFNRKISVELDINNNLISCPHCPDKFFAAVSLSKHYQEFHPNKNQEKVLISKKDLKPDPDLLEYSNCDKNIFLKEDLEEHQKNNDDDLPLESFVQVWDGSPERSTENPKDGSLMSDEIKIEINSVIGLQSDINNVQAENKSSDHMMTNSSEKIRCDICSREFTTVSNLRMHMVSHKTSVDFTCYLCGRTHETKHALYYHVRKEHSNEPHYGLKKISCEICGQKVIHARMDKHMIKHFRDPFKCKICGKEFQQMRKFNNHMDNHRTTKDFICSLCGMKFQNRNTLSVHKTNQHKKEKNKKEETAAEAVSESSQKFGTGNRQINTLDKSEGTKEEDSESPLTDDNLSFSPENKVPCKTCGKYFAKTSMPRHKKLHMKNVFKCWICQKEFNLAPYLKAHLETHKESKDHVCPYCGKSYKTKNILRKHIKIVCRNDIGSSDNNSHAEGRFPVENEIKPLSQVTMKTETEEISGENLCEISRENVVEVIKQKEVNDPSLKEGEGKIPCEICSKLITKKQMINHIKVHRLSVQCQCEICGEVVEDRKMKFHFKKHYKAHDNQSKSNYKCSICQKQFETSASLKEHMETHTASDLKPKHICSICQKQFKRAPHLKQHMESHNETKEYICSFCGKKYKTKVTLTEHIHQHTKVRPLPCKFCDKIFYFYSARTFHIRAHHTGEKPYKCDICDERFYISTRKVQHMRKHTGEKPFSCNECGKNYSDSSSLCKHMKHVHKEVKSSDI